MSRFEVAVIIASTGRPESLSTAIRHFSSQSQPPAKIILSVASPDDLPADAANAPLVEYVIGPRGSTIQRNTGLNAVAGKPDIIAFFDDDYIPSSRSIEQIARFFESNSDVAGANGLLLADGINSPGISTKDAEHLVREYDATGAADISIRKELDGLYGCNMAFRTSMLGDAAFDERLRLYGWQEDIDFAAQLLGKGRLVQTHAFAGVHQGVKTGRTSGVRFGYAQVINPLYLARKGTMRPRYAIKIILKNVIANHLRAVRPEPWVDRIGRIRGNWIAVGDALRGRLHPERVELL